jgi:hypothetical protein
VAQDVWEGAGDVAQDVEEWANELWFGQYGDAPTYTLGGLFYYAYWANLVADGDISGSSMLIPSEYWYDLSEWTDSTLDTLNQLYPSIDSFDQWSPVMSWLSPETSGFSLDDKVTPSGTSPDMGAVLYEWLIDYTGWPINYPPGLGPP